MSYSISIPMPTVFEKKKNLNQNIIVISFEVCLSAQFLKSF